MVLVTTRVRRAWRSWRSWRAWQAWRAWQVGRGGAALLAGAALCACALLAARSAPSPTLYTEARFPHVAPRALAHALADFSNHPRLYPHLGEWTVEVESGNYSAWRYEVAYSCGARCEGRARVLALDAGAGAPPAPPAPPAAHAAPAPADVHTVTVTHRACTRVCPLPWPYFCDEWETEAEVRGDGAGGAVLRERARGGAGAGAGACGARRLLAPRSCAEALRRTRDDHLQRLRVLLKAYEI